MSISDKTKEASSCKIVTHNTQVDASEVNREKQQIYVQRGLAFEFQGNGLYHFDLSSKNNCVDPVTVQ